MKVARTKRGRLRQTSLAELLVFILSRTTNYRLTKQQACRDVSNYLWDNRQIDEKLDFNWNYSHDSDNQESDIRRACQKAKAKGWIKRKTEGARHGVWQLTAIGVERAAELARDLD